jgi:hypothetical protein
VQLLGGLGDGVFDDGVLGGLSAVVVHVDSLVDGGFVEADGIDGGGSDPLFAADEGELAENRGERGRQRIEAEVREPEAEIELVGHGDSVQAVMRR